MPRMIDPLGGANFSSRREVADVVRALWRCLKPYMSEGAARVRLGHSSADFSETVAELEGFARPLWGLAPLAAGGHRFDSWKLLRRGLDSGSNPDHPEFWGAPGPKNQRLVEAAAIGFALAIAPEKFWSPLGEQTKLSLGTWLRENLEQEALENNWQFFPVLIGLGLQRVGFEFRKDILDDRLEFIDSLYVDDGWYRDGSLQRVDHYNGFAFHFYGLIYSVFAENDDARRKRFRERAILFARQYRHWFASDGSALAFGRSQTYRFAQAAFWGALAFANVEALPWPEIRGLWSANLRWWAKQDFLDRDGVMPIGYSYPNLLMSETYNSRGSPYWAFKAFLPLALPDEHPFWKAEEIPPAYPEEPECQRVPGKIIYGESGNTIALSAGNETGNHRIRGHAEKYCKFAYSTRYGFSVESDSQNNRCDAFDSMLAVSKDGEYFRVRTRNEIARIGLDYLFSLWCPWPDVRIQTWLMARPPWHLRIHIVESDQKLHTIEGGFAIQQMDETLPKGAAEPGYVGISNHDDFSGIRQIGGVRRSGVVGEAPPNTNILFPRTWVPQLEASLQSGPTLLAAAVLASPDISTARKSFIRPPKPPPTEELKKMRNDANPVLG